MSHTAKREMLDYALKHPSVDRQYWENGHKSFHESIVHLMEFTSRQLPPDREEEFWRKYLLEVQDHVAQIRAAGTRCYDSGVPKYYCFLTINYDDSTSINIDVMHQIAQRVCALHNVVAAMYNHEKFTPEEGVHHHSHFLIATPDYISASKFIEPIFKMAIVKKYVKAANFIHCQVRGAKKNPAESYEVYVKYLSGEKKEVKMPYVLQDREWRIHNDHQHYYEYKKS